MSLVSIITPVYNSERFLEETIQSVVQQSYPNWEMILIDDCSTDQSRKIINTWTKKDKRIRSYFFEQNAGSAKARNQGISMATGTYMAFLDSDDLWLNTFLEETIHFMEANTYHFISTSYKRVDENLHPLLEDFVVPKRVSYTDILKTCSISCLTSVININVLGKEYMEPLSLRQDYTLWLKYIKKVTYVYGIVKPLAMYRIRKASLSRNKWTAAKYQWLVYWKIEKLGFFKSAYYLAHWAVRGLIKYSS